MMLWQVWHPRYGVVYDELQAIKRGRYGPYRRLPPGAGAGGEGDTPMTQLALIGLQVGGGRSVRHVTEEKSPPAGRELVENGSALMTRGCSSRQGKIALRLVFPRATASD